MQQNGGTWDDADEVTDEFGDMILEDTSLSPRRSSPATSPLKPMRSSNLRTRGGGEEGPSPSPSPTLSGGVLPRKSAPGSPYNSKRSGIAIEGEYSRGSDSFVSPEQRARRRSSPGRSPFTGGERGGQGTRVGRNDNNGYVNTNNNAPVNMNGHDANSYGQGRRSSSSYGSAGRLRGERSDYSAGSRRSQVPYDPKRDPQEGFIGHPLHYGFGSTKRFWEPASGGDKEARSLFYFGREDGLLQGEDSGGRRRRRPASASSSRPSVMEQTVLTPSGKLIKPFAVNWQAGEHTGRTERTGEDIQKAEGEAGVVGVAHFFFHFIRTYAN